MDQEKLPDDPFVPEVSPDESKPKRKRKVDTTVKQRQKRYQTNLLVKTAKETELEQRKCRARAKVRDENGVALKDEHGKFLRRPCPMPPIKGGFVCINHGGRLPQVKAKAAKRLLALVEPALVRVSELMLQDEHKPTALAAADLILKRAGAEAIGPLATKVETDMRPVINVGIQVGGIAPKQVSTVKVGLLPAGVPEPVVVDAEVSDEDS